MLAAYAFKGKSVAVFGLARSGIACVYALRRGGAKVAAWDDNANAVLEAQSIGVPIVNLAEADFSQFDALILSPGVPLTHPKPHWTVKKALATHIEIIGDGEVLQREILNSGAKIVAITGTNGKSTITALIAHLLKENGLEVEAGGNIGRAMCLLPHPTPGLIYVLELSSFQIELMPSVKPDIAILTNITPDHLDRHGTIENYAAVKARLFSCQNLHDLALIGVDDDWSEAIARNYQKTVMVRPVSVQRNLIDGLCAPEGILHDRHRGVDDAALDLCSMAALRGRHNWQNAAMAYGAAKALGLNLDQIARGMRNFPGLQHRMQEIAQIADVAYINDSKATNADAAAKALSSFEKIYWIAGGLAKAGGIGSLSGFFPKIEKAYLIGQAAEEFAQLLGSCVRYEICKTLDNAVQAAHRDAPPGSVVLFSPACASFDQYANFEVRGEAFVHAVLNLTGEKYAGIT